MNETKSYFGTHQANTLLIHEIPHRKIKIVGVELPEEILKTMRNRNNGVPEYLHAWYFREGDFPVIMMFDALSYQGIQKNTPQLPLSELKLTHNSLRFTSGLEETITIVGVNECFEFWNPSDFKEHQSKMDFEATAQALYDESLTQ